MEVEVEVVVVEVVEVVEEVEVVVEVDHLDLFAGSEYPGQSGTSDTQTLHEVWNNHWQVSGGWDVIRCLTAWSAC